MYEEKRLMVALLGRSRNWPSWLLFLDSGISMRVVWEKVMKWSGVEETTVLAG